VTQPVLPSGGDDLDIMLAVLAEGNCPFDNGVLDDYSCCESCGRVFHATAKSVRWTEYTGPRPPDPKLTPHPPTQEPEQDG
jgi:hypothetical protein